MNGLWHILTIAFLEALNSISFYIEDGFYTTTDKVLPSPTQLKSNGKRSVQ